MARHKNVIGQIFGRLTVLNELAARNKYGHILVHCTCSCGKTAVVRKASLSAGQTTSCGCVRIELKRRIAGEASKSYKYYHYKSSARHRGYVFSLSKAEFTELSLKNCHYCGSPPLRQNRYYKKDGNLIHGRTSKESADRAWIAVNGVDRLNNSIGYVKENCVPCCKLCNQFKMTLTKEDFLAHVKRIATFQTKREQSA